MPAPSDNDNVDLSTMRSRSTAYRFAAVFSLCLGLMLCACEKDARDRDVAPQRDVVLITIDTLRADHVGLYGYPRATTPNIDRWFAGGATYLRAYSTHASTPQSVVSFLSGLLPQEHRVRLYYQLLPDDVALVSDLLPKGYQTAAFVSNMLLTDEALGIAGRFDHYDDLVDQLQHNRDVFERNAARTTDAALAWLEAKADADRPLFLWLHYMDPHGPYHPPPDWKMSFEHAEPVPIDVDRVSPYMRIPGVTDGLVYIDRYDEEIAYADSHIGRLLDGYAQRRSPEETLFLLTADHGEAMMEHEFWFTHGYHAYDAIVRVPLLVRGPGVAAGKTPKLASGIDIPPTVLRFAGALPPPQMRGADLRASVAADPARTVFAEGRGLHQHRAAVRGTQKWLVSVEPGSGKVLWKGTFDLAADPEETKPKPWDGSPTGRALLELCRSDPDPGGAPKNAVKGTKLEAPKIAPRVSAEVRERLRALGYADEPPNDH